MLDQETFERLLSKTRRIVVVQIATAALWGAILTLMVALLAGR